MINPCNLHITLLTLILLTILAACGQPDPREARMTDVQIDIRSEIELSGELESPLFVSAAKRDECTIAFVDVRVKRVFTAGVCEPSFGEVSVSEDAPHQFDFPYRVFDFDGLLGISDMDKNEFILLDENDELHRSISYNDQPGRSLVYDLDSDYYYRTDTGMYLMSRVKLETGNAEKYFLLPQPFQAFSIIVHGGGIQRIDDKIYTISSLMPYIYVFNETEEKVEYLLPDFMEYSLNTRRLPDVPFEEQNAFLAELREYQQYNNLLTIEYLGETQLLIFYTYLNEFYLAIVNTEGEAVVNQQIDYYILGTFDDAIIGMDVETEQVFLLDIGM